MQAPDSTTAVPRAPDGAPLLRMLEVMMRIRAFDREAGRLSRAGQIPGVIHLSLGQEATAAGACLAIEPGDLVTSNHRDHGHAVALGSDPGRLMAELLGKATGVCAGKGGSQHLIDTSVGLFVGSAVLGGAIPAAVGAAFAARRRNSDTAVLAFFGEGAANEGVVHESMNLAATWRLPVVFLCENNGYAVSVSASAISSAPDIGARAAGYGMSCQTVDGQDVVAVWEAATTALRLARRGDGPSIVEAKTYRYCDHGENLLIPPYRSDEEVARWRERDPIQLLIDGPLSRLSSPDEIEAIRARADADMAVAVEFALASPWPDASARDTDLYSEGS